MAIACEFSEPEIINYLSNFSNLDCAHDLVESVYHLVYKLRWGSAWISIKTYKTSVNTINYVLPSNEKEWEACISVFQMTTIRLFGIILFS